MLEMPDNGNLYQTDIFIDRPMYEKLSASGASVPGSRWGSAQALVIDLWVSAPNKVHI